MVRSKSWTSGVILSLVFYVKSFTEGRAANMNYNIRVLTSSDNHCCFCYETLYSNGWTSNCTLSPVCLLFWVQWLFLSSFHVNMIPDIIFRQGHKHTHEAASGSPLMPNCQLILPLLFHSEVSVSIPHVQAAKMSRLLIISEKHMSKV